MNQYCILYSGTISISQCTITQFNVESLSLKTNLLPINYTNASENKQVNEHYSECSNKVVYNKSLFGNP